MSSTAETRIVAGTFAKNPAGWAFAAPATMTGHGGIIIHQWFIFVKDARLIHSYEDYPYPKL
jgi:hypothetical protein